MTAKQKVLIFAALAAAAAICIGGGARFDGARGRQRGYRSEIEVSAQRNKDDTFTLTLDRQNENYGIGDLAARNVVQMMNDQQTCAIDALSGATETSVATIAACEQALDRLGYDTGAMKAQKEAANAEVQYIDYHCDVAVVGAGGAGLTAAISSAQAGAKTMVVEKMGIAGGSTARSNGYIMASGTWLQEYNGIEDSASSMAGYLFSAAGESVQENRLVGLSADSADNIEFLKSLGVRFSDALTTAGSDATKRVHIIVNEKGEATGGAMIEPMLDSCADLGVDILYNCTVSELVRDVYGTVIGVRGTDPDGNVITVWAKSVVLATGGYDRNSLLIDSYNESGVLPSYSYASEGNTGDGVSMAAAAGAEIDTGTLMAQLYDFSGITNDLHGLLVTPAGERFVNEAADAFALGGALQAQRQAYAYLIIDKTQYSAKLAAGLKDKTVYQADSLEGLAAAIGAKSLAQTVQSYNAACQRGEDSEYGKDAKYLHALSEGPFCAVLYKLRSYGTMGGIVTNQNGQVISSMGEGYIPNLYACGETANGACFDETYPGFGASLAQIIDSGRKTGTAAAASALAETEVTELDPSEVAETGKNKKKTRTYSSVGTGSSTGSSGSAATGNGNP